MTNFLVPRVARTRSVRPHLLGDFDRVFNDMWRGFGDPASNVGTPATLAPRMDYHETDKEIRVAAELPGLDEKDINVSLEEGVLTIRGERNQESSEDEEGGVSHVETFRGSFQRALRLNREIDEAAVTAVYKNGVLTVTLPKVEEPTPEVHAIPVTAG